MNPGLSNARGDRWLNYWKLNLTTWFLPRDGIVHAVNGISFELDEGESMAICRRKRLRQVGVDEVDDGIIPPPGRAGRRPGHV